MACALLFLGLPAVSSAHRLDKATATLVGDWSRAVYWLCGEADDCDASMARCYRIGVRRIDCVFGYQNAGETRRCGVVISVRLRGRQLFGGSYRCHGKLRPVTKARYIRPGRKVRRHRFRINASWLESPEDVAQDSPNRYGKPRFDPGPDLYVPRGAGSRAARR